MTEKIDMKDQKWGMELEFTGISRGWAAKKLQEVLGGRVVYDGGAYCTWSVYAPDGRIWKVMRDSSIHIQSRTDGKGSEQCEFVTPVCTYDDIETMQECIRRLRKAGAKVNGSCGLHIHIDASRHTGKTLRNLAFTFKAKQDLIFKAVGTQSIRLKRWCKPIDDALIDSLKKIPGKTLDRAKMEDEWYNTYAPGQYRGQHYNSSRYHALNLHATFTKGTVEFRLFEGTLHAGEIRAWLNLCLAMNAAALNSKRSSAEVLQNGNDKYAMRCWLLRLGFIGDEWKTVREHLMKNLSGNAAWRNAPETYESYTRRRDRSA